MSQTSCNVTPHKCPIMEILHMYCTIGVKHDKHEKYYSKEDQKIWHFFAKSEKMAIICSTIQTGATCYLLFNNYKVKHKSRCLMLEGQRFALPDGESDNRTTGTYQVQERDACNVSWRLWLIKKLWPYNYRLVLDSWFIYQLLPPAHNHRQTNILLLPLAYRYKLALTLLWFDILKVYCHSVQDTNHTLLHMLTSTVMVL